VSRQGRRCGRRARSGGPLLGAHQSVAEHIGRGQLGLAAFRRLVRDRRFAGLPICIETPKGDGLAEDRRNLRVLRRLRRR
jgi:deoxyribonuclease-4